MQIKPLSSIKDIKKSYRRLSRLLHSDLGGDEEMMRELNWAYKTLMDYVENYKFSFSEDEINRQYPGEFIKKFRI